jgi:hypothetical protein
MPKYPWPTPLVSYTWNAPRGCYELTACYDYILVKESPAMLSVSSMRVVNLADAKLRACPFMVLSDGATSTAISSDGLSTPFAFDDHPLIARPTHVDENWALVNSCASVTTYVMRHASFEFHTAEVILSSTMCLPLSMAASDVPYYAHCRRGHVDKQLADCRVLLQHASGMSLYNAQTFALLKTFAT